MIHRPNGFQRFLHRFFMLRPVTAFFAPRVHRLDRQLLKWTKNRYAAAEILGWPIIQLTTIGAKTKRPRTTPLIGIFEAEQIILIASNFGRQQNPGWYYNLKTHPECEVIFHGNSRKYIARELKGEEYLLYWKLALTYYAGYEKYKERAVHRHIPLILLEPTT